jgi:hypothetical protein
MMIAQVAHEASASPLTENYALASALLNQYEYPLNSTQYSNMSECIEMTCMKFQSPVNKLEDKFFDMTTGELMEYDNADFETAKRAVDIALSGTRAFGHDVKFWVGNGDYNRFSSTYKETSGF